MQITTVLASLLAALTAVSAQSATYSPQFDLACYPTKPGGGYTYGSSNPFPHSTANSTNATTSTTICASASTGLPIHTTNGTYTMPNATSTVTSTFVPRSSSAYPGSTTETSIITNWPPTSQTASASQATVSAASTARPTSAALGLELGAEGFFALGLAALVFAAAL